MPELTKFTCKFKINKCVIECNSLMIKILSPIYYLCDFQGIWFSVLQRFHQKMWLHLKTNLQFLTTMGSAI